MESPKDLPAYLERWGASDDTRAPVARTLTAFAAAAVSISDLVRKPGCGDDPSETLAAATAVLREQLSDHVQVIIGDPTHAELAADGPRLAAVIQPLTNHDKLDFNGPLGTILTIVPIDGATLERGGVAQRAAAIVSYGARTALALTVGQGTFLYDLDPARGAFVGDGRPAQVKPKTNRYAINTSHQRNWNLAIKDYVDDLLSRTSGPLDKQVNLHWTNSLVLETFQVLTRGGVCMYPAEGARDCVAGCVGLVEEANPIAWLVEQAGGGAINGVVDIFDIEDQGDDPRTPFIFGACEEVELVARYCRTPSILGTHSALFGTRGFFR